MAINCLAAVKLPYMLEFSHRTLNKYIILPAYWSRDKFEQLMPFVEGEIDLRLWILRGNATMYANKVRYSIKQSGGTGHGMYYIAEKGYGTKRPSIYAPKPCHIINCEL